MAHQTRDLEYFADGNNIPQNPSIIFHPDLIATNSGIRWIWRVVEGMEALDTWLDNRGCSEASMWHRISKANSMFHAKKALFCASKLPVKRRSDASYSTCVPAALHGARVQTLTLRRVRIGWAARAMPRVADTGKNLWHDAVMKCGETNTSNCSRMIIVTALSGNVLSQTDRIAGSVLSRVSWATPGYRNWRLAKRGLSGYPWQKSLNILGTSCWNWNHLSLRVLVMSLWNVQKDYMMTAIPGMLHGHQRHIVVWRFWVTTRSWSVGWVVPGK